MFFCSQRFTADWFLMLHAERKIEGVVLAMLLQVLIARLPLLSYKSHKVTRSGLNLQNLFLCLYYGENVVNGFKYGFKQG